MTQHDEWGRTSLHYAARDGDLDEIGRLLPGEDVNAHDIEGWTPLHFAARYGHNEAVSLLLNRGAEVDALTEKGMPAIYWAANAVSGDPIATIRILRARGADPRRPTIQTDFGLKSPLHFISQWVDQAEIQAEFADL